MLASSLFKEKRLMTQVLAISAAIVAVMTILAFGEPTIQRTMGDGAQAQHSTKVRDQACYRRCRNDMRKSTSACNRLCR
jgi:wyosine [tRNA(Phe)-imidazoG37] synthetase (radical SAM superfamily)